MPSRSRNREVFEVQGTGTVGTAPNGAIPPTATTVASLAIVREDYSPEFKAVWKIHHRGPKREAFKFYKKAVANGITHPELLKALKLYVAGFGKDFTGQHLFRWIKDERWEEQEATRLTTTTTTAPGSIVRRY